MSIMMEKILEEEEDIYYIIFKTNSITNEPRLLKFTDTYSYLKQSNPIPKLIVKVNVVE